jgi:hypothetical protein
MVLPTPTEPVRHAAKLAVAARARGPRSPLVVALMSCILCGVLALPAFAFQVEFPAPPTNGAVARDSLEARRDKVADTLACGDDIRFWGLMDKDKLADDPLGSAGNIIAKMMWLIRNPTPVDTPSKVNERMDEPRVTLVQFSTTTPPPLPAQLPCTFTTFVDAPDLNFTNGINDQYNKVCGDGDGSKLVAAPLADKETVRLDYTVTGDCMRRQINFAIMSMSPKDFPGSDDLPCYLWTKGTTKGNWDMGLLGVTRIFYLNQLHLDAKALDQPTVDRLKEQLMTLDGPPGVQSYSVFQCGNHDDHRGDAEQRLAERSWFADSLPSVSHLGKWLGLRLFLILAVIVAAALIGAALVATGVLSAAEAAVAGTILAIAVGILIFVRIPESENHILMIETSRYLKNQDIIADLKAKGDDASDYEDDQEDLKDLFMDKFKTLLSDDFEEYNARAYSGFSINAILNLADFAQDADLKKASRMVLDYVFAKAATGTNLSRRLVPYRRKMEAMRFKKFQGLFELTELGDHLMPYVMFYTGQTQQAADELFDNRDFATRRRVVSPGAAADPDLRRRDNMVGFDMLDQMIVHASSTLDPSASVPEDHVLDIAIDKSRTYEQRIKIKDASVEIYSSGNGWLIIAGGIQAPAKNYVLANVKPLFRDDDRGAAWPTTLMLNAGPQPGVLRDRVRMAHLIRIEGVNIVHSKQTQEDKIKALTADDGNFSSITSIQWTEGRWIGSGVPKGNKSPSFNDRDETSETYDGNICVAHGFACGFNLRVPDHLSEPGCLQAQAAPDDKWAFLDTSTCRFYQGAPEVFVAIRREPCPSGKCDNFGIVEVASASDVASFASFKAKALANRDIRLTKGFALNSDDDVNGTYTTVTGHRLNFAGTFDKDSSALCRITGLDGREVPEDSLWDLASGDFIRGSDAKIEIGRRGERLLKLDLSDKDKPKRELH